MVVEVGEQNMNENEQGVGVDRDAIPYDLRMYLGRASSALTATHAPEFARRVCERDVPDMVDELVRLRVENAAKDTELAAERERATELKSRLDGFDKENDEWMAECDQLKAEAERLRAALTDICEQTAPDGSSHLPAAPSQQCRDRALSVLGGSS